MNYLIIALLCLFSGASMAQSPVFLVLAVKGKVSSAGKPVGVGQKLSSKQSLILEDQAQVGLMLSNGKTAELNQPGTYALDEMAARLSAQKDFKDKYTDYVVKGITQKTTDSKHQKFMALTGSVERGFNKSDIAIQLPFKSDLLLPEMQVWWSDEHPSTTYHLVVMNMKEEVVHHQNISQANASIDWSNIHTAPDQYYLLCVIDSVARRKSEYAYVYIPESKEREKRMAEEQEFKSALDIDQPVSHLALAAFYKSHRSYAEMVSAMKKAMEQFPNHALLSEAMENMIAEMREGR